MEDRFPTAGRRSSSGSALRVFQICCRRPLLTQKEAVRQTGLTFPAVAKGMAALERLGIVRETTGKQRNRIFAYDRYLGILSEGTEAL